MSPHEPLPSHLPVLIRAVAPVIEHYGYGAVGALVCLEDFGVPVPGETVLVAAAVFAGLGRLSVVWVGLIGFVAAVVGDNIGFAIGRFGGRPLALRFGRYIFLTEPRLDKATSFFTRQGGKVVVIARFVEVLRQANGIVAGITGMAWHRFLAANVLGAALWVGLWVNVGYFGGSHLEAVHDYELYFGIAVGAAIALFLAHRIFHWRRSRKNAAVARSGDGSASGLP
ncbi:MAG: DedA family protein [Acidimicrobiales bacterium]